jgi:hypothetical protein
MLKPIIFGTNIRCNIPAIAVVAAAAAAAAANAE